VGRVCAGQACAVTWWTYQFPRIAAIPSMPLTGGIGPVVQSRGKRR
jgi:hypothetical protein